MQQVTNVPPADVFEEQPSPTDDLLDRPSLGAKIASLSAVIFPFLGFIAACVLLWDSGASWLNLGMLIVGYILTAIGITVGFHRLFTHKSFATGPVMTAVLGILGSMSVQGSILMWVANHRMHHQHSDHEHDPHSPHHHGTGIIAWLHGFWHAHIGWFFSEGATAALLDRYVPDLKADRVTRVVSNLFVLWVFLGFAIPALIGLIVTGTWYGALTGLIWGGLLRVFLVHHVTWSVNSVCHIWGSHPFNSRDQSRNNPIFGILAFGEGWHNNHHAFPASARHGLAWWQFDLAYIFIRTLEKLRLAWDVKIPSQDRIESKRISRHERRALNMPQVVVVPQPAPVRVGAHHAAN